MSLDLQNISNWHSWRNLNMLDIIYTYISLNRMIFCIWVYQYLGLLVIDKGHLILIVMKTA